jgi:hypothetical protein
LFLNKEKKLNTDVKLIREGLTSQTKSMTFLGDDFFWGMGDYNKRTKQLINKFKIKTSLSLCAMGLWDVRHIH